MKCFPAIMSEFKYACPVCGQHIKCDSSQSGSQMVCPTCFQKIIVPQAPTEEQKFILTGTKVGEDRPVPKTPEPYPYSSPPPAKNFSGVAVVVIILLFIMAAVGFVYHGTIFKKPALQALTPPADQTTPPQKKQAPMPAAPPSNDANWMLNLKDVTIPDSLAAGRLEGQDFICQRAVFSNGNLNLHDGDLSFAINFGGAAPEALAGKTIHVSTNATTAARISLHWKDGDQAMRESFTNDYAMLLNFDSIHDNRITGEIYLCTSDKQKSYVAGTFQAEIRKGKPKNQ